MTQPTRRWLRAIAPGATGLTLALSLAACADSSEGSGEGSGVPSSELSEAGRLVPEEVRAEGTLTVGTDPSYPPHEFLDGDQSIVGMDIDLFDALAAELNLETDYASGDFASIIAETNKGNYDVGVSSFTINEERKLDVNMVSYFNAGTQWAAEAGNPAGVNPDSPCGLKVAVQGNTLQDEQDVQPKAEACAGTGVPLEVQRYSGQDQATSALVSGRADAIVADSPVVAYAVQQTEGAIEPVGEVYDEAPYGYVIPMENPELADAIQMALTTLADDGTYGDVLEKWGQSQGAINDFAINP